MSVLRTILTHLLTALVTAGVVSIYWYAVYHDREPARLRESAQQKQEQPQGRQRALVKIVHSPNRQALILGPTGLAIPVAGVKLGQLFDTFNQARADGGRVHDAIDIMAPRGTPVIAAAPGRVEKLYFSEGGGGISAYVRSEDGVWIYYYAHLQDYAPGLREGQQVKRGDLIGNVGSTGNANPDGPHLHFAILHMAPGEKWHQGTAINPYPLLAGKNPAR